MWTYEQASGRLLRADGTVAGVGYSGHEEGKNNPAMEAVARVGPIPRGRYRRGDVFDSPTHGPRCIRLLPLAGNDMHGRSGFLMHGDSVKAPGTASLGCIIQARAVRLEFAGSPDDLLEVVEG